MTSPTIDADGIRLSSEQTGPSSWRVVVAGEIDAASAPHLSAVVDPLVRSDRPSVVVNLEDVTFMDSSGLRALVRAANDAKDAGGSLVLARVSGAVVRLLEVTGLMEHLRGDGPHDD